MAIQEANFQKMTINQKVGKNKIGKDYVATL